MVPPGQDPTDQVKGLPGTLGEVDSRPGRPPALGRSLLQEPLGQVPGGQLHAIVQQQPPVAPQANDEPAVGIDPGDQKAVPVSADVHHQHPLAGGGPHDPIHLPQDLGVFAPDRGIIHAVGMQQQGGDTPLPGAPRTPAVPAGA